VWGVRSVSSFTSTLEELRRPRGTETALQETCTEIALAALAATWDPEATEAMADIIRRQMRAVGLLQALARWR
jgi:hypothetical protein